jgi:LAO/AO transport system kinase
MDVIFVETVGVGQSEVDIKDLVDTTAVVLVPESGDSIQAMKAGLLEIADVFIVNKKDRPGADQVARDLEALVMGATSKWRAPVVMTEAIQGEGVGAAWNEILHHQSFEQKEGLSRGERIRRREHEFFEIVQALWLQDAKKKILSDRKMTEAIQNKKAPNVYRLARAFLEK